MKKKIKDLTFSEIMDICRSHCCFPNVNCPLFCKRDNCCGIVPFKTITTSEMLNTEVEVEE